MVKLERNPDYPVAGPPLSSDFPVLLLSQPNVSAYSTYSVTFICLMHGHATLSFVQQYIFLLVPGKTPYKALSEWFVSNGTRGTYVEKPLDRPECNPSCCSKLCIKCRKPKPEVIRQSNEPAKVIQASGKLKCFSDLPAYRKKSFLTVTYTLYQDGWCSLQ